jgi:hypothetical protein
MSVLAPYRTLVLLLWTEHSWRDQLGTGVSIATGPASRFLKLPAYRLRQHLKWLETNSFISGLRLEYGKAHFTYPSKVAGYSESAEAVPQPQPASSFEDE